MTDHIRFNLDSEKNAPLGSFNTHDGTITINLDEIAYTISEHTYCNHEANIIATLIDVIIHEELHKNISEAQDNQETFNEQDERVYMVIRDWVEYNKAKSIVNFD